VSLSFVTESRHDNLHDAAKKYSLANNPMQSPLHLSGNLKASPQAND